MKSTALLVLGMCVSAQLWGAKEPAEDIRGKIGSTFAAPVKANGKYYFVATTGVLFEASPDFKKVTKLFEGKKQTLGNLILHEGKLYWGDGLHQDTKSTLHIFDLKSKKLEKEIEVAGHIERPIFIQGNSLIIPSGPGGVTAVDTSGKTLWTIKSHEGKNLHVDSNLVVVGNKVCGTTLYETKGVICFDPKSGKVLQLSELKKNPKSEITVWQNHVVGFATDADLMKSKFDLPSDFFVYDVEGNKMKFNKELRGFNFFAPHITGDDAFITLSTGDFILFNITSGKIEFLGEFPEPFVNNSFMKDGNFCGIAIMGKYMCYTKTKSGYALATDKRLMETVIGKITYDKKLIAPSRIGYYVE